MKENEIDKIFKEKLALKEFPYDPANWDQASAMLDSAKTPVKIHWYRIFTDLFIISILISAFTFSDLNQESEGSNNFKTTSPISNTKNPSLNSNLEAEKNENSINPNENLKNESVTESVITNPKSESEIEKETENPNNNLVQNNSENQVSKNSGAIQNNNSISSNSDKEVNSVENLSNNKDIEELVSTDSNISASKTDKQTIAETNLNDSANARNQNQIENESYVSDSDKSNKEQESVSSEKEDYIAAITDMENDDKAREIPAEKSNSNLGQSFFSLGIETSIHGINRSLSSSNPSLNSWINNRTKEESPLLNYSFGITGSFSKNQWSVQTGIHYVAYEEKVFYDPNIEVTNIIDTSYWNITQESNTSVDSTWVIDSIYTGHWRYDTTTTYYNDSNLVVTKDTVTKNRYDQSIAANEGVNSIQYFEIPLFVSYSWRIKKIYLMVQPGISAGFLTRTRGSTYINYDENGVLSREHHIEQFNQLLWTANFRAGIRYNFDENWSLGIMPSFRYSLNSFFKDQEINQRYFSYGLNMGIYYTF